MRFTSSVTAVLFMYVLSRGSEYMREILGGEGAPSHIIHEPHSLFLHLIEDGIKLIIERGYGMNLESRQKGFS